MVAIDPAAVLAAASAVDGSAADVAALDAVSPFSDVSAALAGSVTSQACTWVSTRLGAALQCWASGLEGTAQAARVTTQDVTATDSAASGGFRTLDGALR